MANHVHTTEKSINRELDPESMVYNTDWEFIDTEQQLKKLIITLSVEKVIAVDLEHHSKRSFQGFLCLIQISTRKKDFLIDAIKLRHKLQMFNHIFTDPAIEKIFHGGDQDNVWLQQVGCYLVNSFDTQIAQQVISKSDIKMGYKYLLEEYLQVTVSKKYQTSDWRQRPLSNGQMNYAREDTRRLLQLADVIKSTMTLERFLFTKKR